MMAVDQAEYEKLLLGQLANGEEEAFTVLYDRYSTRLFQNILRLVKEEDVAKEVLQDLFLKIWESRSTIDPQKSFRSYLYKIAENLVYDHFRKVSRDKKLTENLVISALANQSSTEETGVYEESLHLIQKAIEQLPPVRRQVYMLCKLEGKSYDEIASSLAISTSTISDHIVKANRFIKKFVLTHKDLALSLSVSLLMADIQ